LLKLLAFQVFNNTPGIWFPSSAFKSIEGPSAALALNAALPSQSRITQLRVP
jgi:hypothetical protein